MAVINAGGGTSTDVARLALSGRPLAAAYLQFVNPALFNVPPAPSQAYFHDAFNDNYPLRNQPPLVNTVPGAPAIQAALETVDWLGMTGDPLSFASHLKLAPLSGVPAKSTMFQFGLGDLEVPNPTESALVRAAGGLDNTWYYRFDKASAVDPAMLGIGVPPFPLLPHRYLSNPTIFSEPGEMSVAMAAQQQVATWFSQSDPDPNQLLAPPFTPAMNLFELSPTLPETLNFIQIPQ